MFSRYISAHALRFDNKPGIKSWKSFKARVETKECHHDDTLMILKKLLRDENDINKAVRELKIHIEWEEYC